MGESVVSQNLRRLRQAKGISQKSLANMAGLSRGAYCSIELGKSQPRVRSMRAIAAALGVSVERLVEPVEMLRAVRFRSSKRLRSREQILVDTGRWLSDYNDLERILEDRVECRLGDIREQIGSNKGQCEVAAALAREAFGLDAKEPVHNICGLLESRGIKVGEQALASDGFFGLSVAAASGGPAVVVNTWERIPVERWIFTAAHELGHLILHPSEYDVNLTGEEDRHEEEANAFAAAFLMPHRSFEEEWDDTYGLSFVDRVMKVKRIFRVSYRTVLYQDSAKKLLPRVNVWAQFQIGHQRRYGCTLLREDEPAALAADAFRASFPESKAPAEPNKLAAADFIQDRLSKLVRLALEQEQISLARGAEVLGLSLLDMRHLAAAWVS